MPGDAVTNGAGIRPTIIGRAFELARSGDCEQITRISDRLIREGYEGVHQHLNGTQIRRELRQMIKDAKIGKAGSGSSDGQFAPQPRLSRI